MEPGALLQALTGAPVAMSWQIYFFHFFAAFAFLVFIPFSTRFQTAMPRTMLAIGLALLMPQSASISDQSHVLSGILSAVFWGALCAMPLFLTAELLRMGTQIIETVRGQNIEGLYAPQTGEQETPLELFVFYLTLVIMLSSGMLEQCLRALLSGVPELMLTNVARSLFAQVMLLVQTLLMYAAPVLCLYLLVDLGMGVLSKQLPRMMLTAEVYVAKVFLTLAGLLVFFLPNVAELLAAIFNSLSRLTFSVMVS
jgi:flagellar biosynthesis protein FliR